MDWSSAVCSSALQSSFAPSPHARHVHRKPCCHVTGHAVRGRPCAGRDGEVLLHWDIGRSRRDSYPYLERTNPLSGFRLSRTHHAVKRALHLFLLLGALIGLFGQAVAYASVQSAPMRSEEHTSELQSLM